MNYVNDSIRDMVWANTYTHMLREMHTVHRYLSSDQCRSNATAAANLAVKSLEKKGVFVSHRNDHNK